MSPGLARYFAFSGKARRAARVSPCAAAIAREAVARLHGDRRDRRPQDRVRPGDDIARNASRLALGHGQDERLTLLMSLWPMDGVAVDGSPVALAMAAIRVAQNCFWATVIGYVEP